MKYGNKTKYKCTGCGDETYYHGDGSDKKCSKCGKTTKAIEFRTQCPDCKKTITKQSEKDKWHCYGCGYRGY